jgi:hypothetical protein
MSPLLFHCILCLPSCVVDDSYVKLHRTRAPLTSEAVTCTALRTQGSKYGPCPPSEAPKKGPPLGPDSRGCRVRIIGWRLSQLQESTGQDIIHNLLPLGTPLTPEDTNRALAVARDAGLPLSTVWRRIWAASPKAEADVAAVASYATTDGGAFLAAEATSLSAASVPALRALAAAALDADGALGACGTPPALDSGACGQRLHLLYLCDVADTLLEVHGPSASVPALRTLLDAGLPAAAAAFAASGHVSAVATLLHRHPRGVGRDALTALSALPASLQVQDYLPLLQRLLELAQNPGAAAVSRAADVVESPEFLAHLPSAIAPSPTESVLACRSTPLADLDEVDAWVVERACSIDDETGLASLSLSLLKAWAAAGRSAAGLAAASVHMWLTMLRHGALLGEEAQRHFEGLSVRHFLNMTGPAQLRSVLVAGVWEGQPLQEGAEVITQVWTMVACFVCSPQQ